MTSPERAAAALLAAYDLAPIDEPPVPVDELAEETEGLDIQEAADLRLVPGAPAVPLEVTLSGLLLPAELRIWVDAVEAARSPGRRRFTIAHELGHWRLHCRGQRHARAAVYCRSEDIGGDPETLRIASAREREANRFAAALLMPEALVRREATGLKLNVLALARRFEVSAPAMKVRLQALDLLPSYMR
jgi:IrrE N-terminal-like domain